MRGQIVTIIDRKFGFVHQRGGPDHYFLIADFPAAQIGVPVEFETTSDERGRKPRAIKIRAVT